MFAVAEEKYIKQKYSDNFVFGTTFIIINENILDVIDRKVNIKGVFFVTFKLFVIHQRSFQLPSSTTTSI